MYSYKTDEQKRSRYGTGPLFSGIPKDKGPFTDMIPETGEIEPGPAKRYHVVYVAEDENGKEQTYACVVYDYNLTDIPPENIKQKTPVDDEPTGYPKVERVMLANDRRRVYCCPDAIQQLIYKDGVIVLVYGDYELTEIDLKYCPWCGAELVIVKGKV